MISTKLGNYFLETPVQYLLFIFRVCFNSIRSGDAKSKVRAISNSADFKKALALVSCAAPSSPFSASLSFFRTLG
jgi:hypothetical protein